MPSQIVQTFSPLQRQVTLSQHCQVENASEYRVWRMVLHKASDKRTLDVINATRPKRTHANKNFSVGTRLQTNHKRGSDSLVNRDIEKTLYLGCMQIHRLEAYQRRLLAIRI